MANRMRYFGVLGLVLAIGFAGHAAPGRAAERLTADTQLMTTGGSSFSAPVGWSVTSATNKTVLEPPEPDSHLALLDVQAADADTAIVAAWASYRPDARRPLRLATPQAPHNGWQE